MNPVQQEKAFLKWCNFKLERRNKTISVFSKDLSDGLILKDLAEILSGELISGVKRGVTLRIAKISNVSLSVKFLDGKGVKSFEPSDIVDGNLKVILALIFQLICKYQLEQFEGLPGRSPVPDRLKNPKKALMDAVNARLAKNPNYTGKQVTNLSKDFNDGEVLNALIQTAPNAPPPPAQNATPKQKVDHALNTLHSKFGVPKLLDSADMTSGQPVDENAVAAYVGCVLNGLDHPPTPLKNLMNDSAKLIDSDLAYHPQSEDGNEGKNKDPVARWNLDISKLLAIVKKILDETQGYIQSEDRLTPSEIDELVEAGKHVSQCALALSELVLPGGQAAVISEESIEHYNHRRNEILNSVRSLQSLLDTVPRDLSAKPKQGSGGKNKNGGKALGREADLMAIDAVGREGDDASQWDLSALASILQRVRDDAEEAGADSTTEDKKTAIADRLKDFTAAATRLIQFAKEKRSGPQGRELRSALLQAYKQLYYAMSMEEPTKEEPLKRDPRAAAAKRKFEEIARTVLSQPGAKIKHDDNDEAYLVKEEVTNIVNGMVDAVAYTKTNATLKTFKYEDFVKTGGEVSEAVSRLASLLGDSNKELESKVLLLGRHFVDAMRGLVDAVDFWNARADENHTRNLQRERSRFIGLVKTMQSAMESIEREFEK